MNRNLMGVFHRESDILEVTRACRERGYEIVDVYAPYPVHGLDRAMGLKPSRIPWACFALGAFGAAKAAGQYRLESFGTRGDLLRSLGGAFLMGFGGVTALGCTIGQGITGLSTLALGSLLAFGAIVAGGVLGLHLLERWVD